ncbi:beta-propeller fold lactonase family protein [Spirochaetia bacterium 38H-sp]|uniref:Beta-propeller fold lactonase family protein n=1 Tax=Rarispira pelagica TaxID=3141764 RepID=A0ABU9U8H4_9SPIR
MKKTLFILLALFFTLRAEAITLSLKIFPTDYVLLLDEKPLSPYKTLENIRYYDLPYGKYELILRAPGYYDKRINIKLIKPTYIEDKLYRTASRLSLIGEYPTGSQPKSVSFSPDGHYLYVALLDDNGVDIFNGQDFSYIKRAEVPKQFALEKGFVESAIVNGLLWISQMTTGRIHIFDLYGNYLYTSDRTGVWPKVICPDRKGKIIYISNWESRDIAVMDALTGRLISSIKVSGIPRGMSISQDNKYLYVCNYEKGLIEKIDTEKKEVIKTIDNGFGARRHIVMDRYGEFAYISDMYKGTIAKLELKTDKILLEKYIGPKLNTIDISSDGKFLFVSSRGHNNPETYLKKGPDFGRVYVLDTSDLSIVDWVWGRNQPTGLAISPDDKFLVFSDFLDGNIEVYDISRLWNDLSD